MHAYRRPAFRGWEIPAHPQVVISGTSQAEQPCVKVRKVPNVGKKGHARPETKIVSLVLVAVSEMFRR